VRGDEKHVWCPVWHLASSTTRYRSGVSFFQLVPPQLRSIAAYMFDVEELPLQDYAGCNLSLRPFERQSYPPTCTIELPIIGETKVLVESGQLVILSIVSDPPTEGPSR
jgi:hypothetical protein